MRKYSILIALLATINILAIASDSEGDLHIKVMRTLKAVPPELYNGYAFFTFQPQTSVRYVGIAFLHEQFRRVHLFQRNDKGVLFFTYRIPEGMTHLDYRLVVDGLWITDPLNPNSYQDSQGISISRFEFLKEQVSITSRSPIIREEEQKVVFLFQAEPGKDIYLTGSFARWDPYLYRMEEVRPGLYTLSLRLLPGTHFYAFYKDGKRIRDPLNKEWRKSKEGQEASILIVPPRS
ncbi:MAG: glycogen-binding domain-containing protein [Spirochaetes bacterium]|nr:glycogen-binding domain-containing protein [Spirochaetota bacterium]